MSGAERSIPANGSSFAAPDAPVQPWLGQGSTIFIVDDGDGDFGEAARLLNAAGFAVHVLPSPSFAADRIVSCRSACVLLGLHARSFDALQLPRTLVKLGCPTPVVFLTDRMDVRRSVMAMKSGATDVLVKPVNQDELLSAVRTAIAQDLTARRARALHDERHQRLALLTPREREVCELVSAGLMNKNIAARMGIAEKTVKIHRGQVMRKLAVHSVAEFMRFVDGLHHERMDIRLPSQSLIQPRLPVDQPGYRLQSMHACEPVTFRSQLPSREVSASPRGSATANQPAN